MAYDSDVIIVGGGLNGAAIALALGRAGVPVTVIDAAPAAAAGDGAFDGRSYALAEASRALLAAIGVWDGIEERTQPILDIKVSDGRPGEGPSPAILGFDHAEIEEGPMGRMVEDRHLRRAFLDAMGRTAGITHLPAERVVAQAADPAGVTVTLASGSTRQGRVLVGADGRASGTAARAGIRRTSRDYGQTALVAAVEHELPHHGIAHQFFMPAGPLAILPLPGNRSSIVWAERREVAEGLARLGDVAFLAALRPRFGDFLGELRLAGARQSYPLALSLANATVAERVALAGDAAHAIHPLAGQGLNLGLRDVAALAEVLVEAHRRGEDIGQADVLARYARWRRFDAVTLAAATDGFDRLFSTDNPLLRASRDAGMAAVNALPGLRRRFIREAAGLTGERPRLLRGRAL